MLEDREWKFDTIPDTEMEACFWWEYVRTGLDKGLRRALARKWRTRPESPRIGGFSLTKSLRKRFVVESVLINFTLSEELYPDEKKGKLSWKPPIEFFLERWPWVRLSQDLRNDFVRGFPFSAFPAFVRPLPHYRHSFEQTAKTEGLEKALEWFDYERFILEELPNDINGPKVPRVVGSTLRVDLDWRFKDVEILSEIKRFLVANRPKVWPEKTRPLGRSLFPEILRRTTHSAALRWLGVLRRHEAGCNWCDFDRVYGSKANEPDLRKQAKLAESIIAWMRDGDRRHLIGLPADTTRRRRSQG